MKMKLYTMYDRVKAEMGGIMMYKSNAEAIRAAEHMLTEGLKNSPAKKEDFKVLYLGQIETDTVKGEILTEPEELYLNLGDK